MKEICTNCPRHCLCDRENKNGFCKAGNTCEIAKIMLHHWEEPIISGTENMAGSGAIFFNHCNLKCVYCQNYEISHQESGKEYSPTQLAQVFKDLESQNALNINLVTPTHYSAQIIQALKIYKPKIPVVWNCGGFEDAKIINQLKGLVDVFLTDFKYYSNSLANKYSSCPNYFEKCSTAILKMREIVPQDVLENGLMKKGLIIRHMVLPNNYKDSLEVLNWIKDSLGTKTYISLLSQYTPHGRACDFPEINRPLKKLEYKLVTNHLLNLGFENGFLQELSSASESFIPDFKNKAT